MIKSKAAFLFGAGISLKAGMPSTSDITNVLTKLNDITRTSDCSYLYKKPDFFSHDGDKYVLMVTEFIKVLRTEIEKYYYRRFEHVRFEANYEDIYYLIKEIKDCLTDQKGNVLSGLFLTQIEPEVNRILRMGKYIFAGHQFILIRDTLQLAEEVENFIEQIVCQLLSAKSEVGLNYLDFIQDTINKYSSDNIDIFTLNHDLVLERYLNDKHIPFVNGFDEHGKYNGNLFENPIEKLSLYKLHGSINWRNYYLHNEGKKENICIPDGTIVDTSSLEDQPIILIGTRNKMEDYYGFSIFTELHNRFFESLSNANRLIVAGYGFRDNGINDRIVNWIAGDKERKIVVIDPNSTDIFNYTPTGIDRNNSQQVMVVEKKIEDCDWNTIEKKM
jgi:SIR2-like domain